ncbi:MAG: DUF1576 domain-containing protein [Bacilli bacterium]|nr:DUF1576 domain-containing protein [Bacilli bacterium]
MMVPYIAGLFIVTSFFVQGFSGVIAGFFQIQVNKSILLTDYIVVGGIGATLLNSGILMMGSYLIVRKIKLNITGPIFAGILTIGGFGFFGKNILNVSVIYFGVFLYSQYKKIPLKSVIVIFLFSTGIAPITSLFMFGLGIPYLYSIPLGMTIGVLSGFVLVELASHVITFHKGYDLYNVGFAGGILALLYFGLIKQLGLSYSTVSLFSEDYNIFLIVFLIVICLSFILVGYIINGKNIDNYQDILSKSGRAITDFTRKNNQGITLFNVGLTGILVLAFVLLVQIKLSGPVIGALMTVIGFSAFGKHPYNVFPGMIGVLIAAFLFGYQPSNISIALAIIFSTALAPITGEHGIVAGVLTGMIHLPLVLSFTELHGGILLYANGFAAAFTAVIVHTVISTIERRDIKWRFTK